MSLKREAKLSIVLACAGALACDPAKKVERAQEQQQKVAMEANEKRAEVSREHAQEAAELTQEQRQERADLEKKQHETLIEQQREAVELGTEQIDERSRVESQIAQDAVDAKTRLSKAAAGLDQKRQEVQSRSRARLNAISARATDITTKAQTATEEERIGVDQALSDFQDARAMVERDIEALSTIAAQNFRRAEKTVNQELAQLEKKLDRAESKL